LGQANIGESVLENVIALFCAIYRLSNHDLRGIGVGIGIRVNTPGTYLISVVFGYVYKIFIIFISIA
jgi:hypothetical protein